MSPVELVARALSAGVRLEAAGGALRCHSAGPLPDDLRAELVAHKPALLAHLSAVQATLPGLEPWDGVAALRLMHQADDLVERVGVSGVHPDVQAAAAAVVSAHATRDLETVRFAVAEFELVVKATAKRRVT